MEKMEQKVTTGLRQLRIRLALESDDPIYGNEEITTPAQAVTVMAKMMATLDRENICVVNLDGVMHPLSYAIVSQGATNESYSPMQNLFKGAILSNSSFILALHNHVSGSLKPSSIDIETTKRMYEAGLILGIPLLDHVIVAAGTGKFYSFRENMPEMFEKGLKFGPEMKQ